MKTAIRIITFVSFALTFGLAAAGIWWLTQLPPKPPPPDLSRDAVYGITFNDEDINQYVHIDIDPVIIATTLRNIHFVESPESSEMTLIQHDRSDEFIIPIFQRSQAYTLLIPTNDVQELSRDYAETFSETLPLDTEMAD